MAYDGSIELISGIKAKNNGTFPLVDAADVYVNDSTRLTDKLAQVADSASPNFTGIPTAPTAEVGTNTNQIATTAFVQNAFTSNDAMIYKGVVNSNSDLPATHKQGWTYKVATAGTYVGVVCEIGDMIICNTDGTSANNAHWNVIQTNIDGAVSGPSSATANHVATFDGTTGKLIKDSGYTIATSVPSGAKFTDTNTKVTSSANHYAPATASGSELTANASGASAEWSIDVVKGISLSTDGKGHITAMNVTSGKIPANPNTDTKVTSSANHYSPSTASGSDVTASASGASAAWSIDVVKGVTLNTDGKGHVTGMSVTSGKIPANPNTDTHRVIKVNGDQALANNTTPLNLIPGSNVTIVDGGSGAITISSKDTTYSNLAAASEGTDESLVTTGDKYNWNNKLTKTGDTMTGRLTISKPINQLLIGTGTAARDAGSGSSPRYFPAKWTFNADTTVEDGDMVTIKIPVAGHSYGVYLSVNNGTNYYPVVISGNARLTTHYGVNTYIILVFEAGGSAASMYPVNGGNSTSTVTGGAWRVINYYDSNTTYVFNGTYNKTTNPAATVSTVTDKINLIEGNLNSTTPGAGKTLTAFSQTAGVVSATFDDISITKSQITDFPTSMTPSSHVHGNIQNGGTLQSSDIAIASGDKLIVTDSSNSHKIARTSLSFDGSTATKALTQKGTWESFTNNAGTITKVQANGTDVASSGTANIPAATTDIYGVTKLSNATNSTSTSLAATANAVKTAYDLANGKVSCTTANVKTALGVGTGSAKFFREDGTWAVPPTGSGTGGGTVTEIATGTGLTGGPITSSGTISLAASGVTAGNYGPSTNVTGDNNATISVPYIAVDTYGRITSIANKTYTSKNTTYSAATTSADGLMSSYDKTKLDGITAITEAEILALFA